MKAVPAFPVHPQQWRVGLIGYGEVGRILAEDLLAADEAYAMAQSGRLTIIDVRSPQEWQETGTPEGAVRANFQAGTEAFVTAVTAALDGGS